MSIPISPLPYGGRRPQRLENWLEECFPELTFICRRFKSRSDGFAYMSIKATIKRHPEQLRFHKHVLVDDLWRQDGFELLIAQLYLVSPR